jgi:HD-GYP domain-containing protein (c-di-GMP phosphodiesterase class II)
MNVVDQRLYGAKQRRSGAALEVQAVLLGVLRECETGLDEHVREVAVLAQRVAVRLGLDPEDVREVALAAHLHDTGKVAVPDSILDKPGPLDEEEWAIMRRHTLFGERIIAAAPALRQVADPRARQPRAVGRSRIPRRPRRTGDPAGISHHPGL